MEAEEAINLQKNSICDIISKELDKIARWLL